MDAEQAEEYCYRFLKIGGGMVLGGLCLMMVAFLFPVAVLLAAAGALVITGDIIWFLRLRNQQGINVTCPYCEKEYNALPGSHTFMCDECQHAVSVPRVA
jgi:uncharacterized Zn-finger protein